ncbi:hypothetical protein L195_g047445, partial [Trifolium pratense]
AVITSITDHRNHRRPPSRSLLSLSLQSFTSATLSRTISLYTPVTIVVLLHLRRAQILLQPVFASSSTTCFLLGVQLCLRRLNNGEEESGSDSGGDGERRDRSDGEQIWWWWRSKSGDGGRKRKGKDEQF